MAVIYFEDTEHMDACVQLEKDVQNHGHPLDRWHRALCYVLTMNETMRSHWRDLYDIRDDLIKRSGLAKGWQTGKTAGLSALAFTLFTDHVPHEKGAEAYDLAAMCENVEEGPYILEAIGIRYGYSPIRRKEDGGAGL